MFYLSFKKFLKASKRFFSRLSVGSLSNPSKGFTMLELIVVMAIFLIITAVVIADIPNFQNKSSLDLTVSEVATYIRGAQVYGASQKGNGLRYGVHLEKNKNNFYLFKDRKPVPGEKPEESYELNGFTILDLKVANPSVVSKGQLDIVFQANNSLSTLGTNLESKIYDDYEETGSLVSGFAYLDIVIRRDRSGATGCLRVYSNGQIVPSCD